MVFSRHKTKLPFSLHMSHEGLKSYIVFLTLSPFGGCASERGGKTYGALACHNEASTLYIKALKGWTSENKGYLLGPSGHPESTRRRGRWPEPILTEVEVPYIQRGREGRCLFHFFLDILSELVYHVISFHCSRHIIQ